MAGSGASAHAILTAGVAGLVAGALSMAAGEYVSVSSQRDSELADDRLERRELDADPAGELDELAGIYRARGLSPTLALEVARALTVRDALEAHVRDELGLRRERRAGPAQAAWSSAVAFALGAALPLVAAGVGGGGPVPGVVLVTAVALVVLGLSGAWLGGAPTERAAARVACWGVSAMGITYGIGALTGAAL